MIETPYLTTSSVTQRRTQGFPGVLTLELLYSVKTPVTSAAAYSRLATSRALLLLLGKSV
jgi:hypothetical protein